MARAKSTPAAARSSATIGFEAKLWLTADKLRSNMDGKLSHTLAIFAHAAADAAERENYPKISL